MCVGVREVWLKSSGSALQSYALLSSVFSNCGKREGREAVREGLLDLKTYFFMLSILCRVLATTTVIVHNTGMFVCVTTVFCHLSGLCGRVAHPQGCSCRQSGVYQHSLDSGSESWVSPVIRSVTSFLSLCTIQHQLHLCKGSPPNSNQSSDYI